MCGKEVNNIELYDWIYGIAQLTAVFLAVVAGFVAVKSLRSSKGNKFLAWKFLFTALVLFAVNEILGALDTFDVIEPVFWTYLIPLFVFLSFITALILQILVQKRWLK